MFRKWYGEQTKMKIKILSIFSCLFHRKKKKSPKTPPPTTETKLQQAGTAENPIDLTTNNSPGTPHRTGEEGSQQADAVARLHVNDWQLPLKKRKLAYKK